MCGRFTLRVTQAELQEHFDATREFAPRRQFNIPPSHTIPIIRLEEGERIIIGAHWGLIPFWAKEAKIGFSMINARSETILEKRSFAKPFKERRCLIPVDGFYEWKPGEGKTKTPFFIHRPDDDLFAFAGIWTTWTSPEGKEIESCSIITTSPNKMMSEIHDRMPVILPISTYDTWLRTPPEKAETLTSLLVPLRDGELTCHPVTTLVNKATNESEKCIEPLNKIGVCDDTAYFNAQRKIKEEEEKRLFPTDE